MNYCYYLAGKMVSINLARIAYKIDTTVSDDWKLFKLRDHSFVKSGVHKFVLLGVQNIINAPEYINKSI